KKIIKKSLFGKGKGFYICALVRGTAVLEGVEVLGDLLGFLWGLKKYFNFFSKNIVGKKKSNYICTRLRDKRLKG
ncbi:hypothetical protein C1T31_13930, partial [Hanstruepera neustonica]